MKALVYLVPGQKALQEHPRPVPISSNDTVVQVRRTTICGTDLLRRTMTPARLVGDALPFRLSARDASMAKAVICIAHTPSRITRLVGELICSGVPPEAISVLSPDRKLPRDAETAGASACSERSDRLDDGPEFSDSSSGVAGGVFGLLAGMGLLSLPGLGLFMASGPIIAALSGAALGVVCGRVAAALIRMGLPEQEAQRYEARLRDGATLVSVQTRSPAQARHVMRVLVDAKAEDVFGSGSPQIRA